MRVCRPQLDAEAEFLSALDCGARAGNVQAALE